MLQNFFKLNDDYEEIKSKDAFIHHLKTSKHLCNLAFMPDELEDIKIENITFENFSFAKTAINKVQFKNCKFIDCLFIGTKFTDVKLHDSIFKCCNFDDCEIERLYANPKQFRDAIKDIKYANIATHLYNQLRNNYKQDSQKTFNIDSEYNFRKWESRYKYLKSKRNNENKITYTTARFFSLLYQITLGFGYKISNTLITAIITIFALTTFNYYLNDEIFDTPVVAHTYIRSLYFTITTMVTLGPTGFDNYSETGYYIVIANVLLGMVLFTVTINLIANRIIK